jgi:hypothetical protein
MITCKNRAPENQLAGLAAQSIHVVSIVRSSSLDVIYNQCPRPSHFLPPSAPPSGEARFRGWYEKPIDRPLHFKDIGMTALDLIPGARRLFAHLTGTTLTGTGNWLPLVSGKSRRLNPAKWAPPRVPSSGTQHHRSGPEPGGR